MKRILVLQQKKIIKQLSQMPINIVLLPRNSEGYVQFLLGGGGGYTVGA